MGPNIPAGGWRYLDMAIGTTPGRQDGDTLLSPGDALHRGNIMRAKHCGLGLGLPITGHNMGAL